MEFTLVKKDKKTIVKLTKKELEDSSNILYLTLKGFNVNNPYKVNSRFIYYSANGDKINKHPVF